jgi:HD-GYP domain-containing protein (c-di-GMP phosphodiesterase class II)
MFKKIRNLLIFSAIIAVAAIVFMVLIVNDIAFKNYSDTFTKEKEMQFRYFIDQNYSDLYDLVVSHAVWTESVDKLVDWDDRWLYDNATGYIVDEELFNVDVMFISDEEGEHKQEYGDIDFDHILRSESYNKSLKYNTVISDVLWIEGSPLLIVASPFFEDDYTNPQGIYIIGRFLEDDEVLDLTKMVSSESLVSVDYKNDKNIKIASNSSYHLINLKVPINTSNENIYADLKFEVDFWKLIFRKEKYYIIGIIVFVAIVVVTYLSMKYDKLSKKMNEVIEAITKISEGNYKSKVENQREQMMPELDVLIDSVNRMSADVQKHMDIVDGHSELLDNKYIEMIHLLVTVVEMNDSYTYHHSVSVSEYALMIGNAISFNDLENLELAAKLHDVGKISIPSEILNKPGKLNEDEYDLIKSHSEEGYKLLNSIDRFSVAKYGVLYHHERYDGNGYPNRLKAEEIPMIAQIIAVADVFDALTSDRSYRKALSYEDAMEILLSEKGKMLNPILVDVFHKELIRRNPRAIVK